MNLTFLTDYEDLWWKPKAKGILERTINFYQRKVSKAEKKRFNEAWYDYHHMSELIPKR